MESFISSIQDYLQQQLEFEVEDIAIHEQMSYEDKIENGLIIPDATILKSCNGEYLLKIIEDNSKVRIGDKVRIFSDSVSGIGQITDIGLDEISISTNLNLTDNDKVDLEILEFVFLQPMIDLISYIESGEKPGLSLIEILKGSQAPKPSGLGALRKLNLDVVGTELDSTQKNVIRDACQRPSVYCIQGPPGTGKTMVLAQIAKEFASRGKEVLVLANTHHAVNNALIKIAYKIPCFNVVKIGETLQSSNLEAHNITSYKTYYSYLRNRGRKRKKGEGDVVGMTLLASVVNLGLRESGFKPQIVLVDEAGQIPMPYASVIGSYGCGSIIFIGDDKQMSPIFHQKLKNHPFSTSIFQYLCNQYPALRKTLDTTYRMNDEITHLVSSCFYDTDEKKNVILASEYSAMRRSDFSRLEDADDLNIKTILNFKESVVLVNVTPSLNDNYITFTDSNIKEAEFMAKVVKIFQRNNIPSDRYAIITPYRRQVKLIRSLVGEYDIPLINTVECLQGQDVESIFISFVASDPRFIIEQLEFLLNPNRLNVMISRAKTKVIILTSDFLRKFLLKRYPNFNSIGIKKYGFQF